MFYRVCIVLGLSVVGIFLGVVLKFASDYIADGELKDPVPEKYWGPEELKDKAEDRGIYEIKITVSDTLIDNWKQKFHEEVHSGRIIAPLEDSAFQYGFNTRYLVSNLSHYWLQRYDWKLRQELLNKYPQFKTRISGIDIHFQHVHSSNDSKYSSTIPLLLIHGFPGSFVEFQKIIDLLTDPEDSPFNFEVIVPSLPGYGFSGTPLKLGLGSLEVAQIFHKLMDRLGFKQFHVHGGSWGSIIGSHLSVMFPRSVISIHSTSCLSLHPKTIMRMFLAAAIPSVMLTPQEDKRFHAFLKLGIQETGFLHLQATKPDTLGISLSQSPSSLAAYILEKFSTWTNARRAYEFDGGLSKAFYLDDVLDNVMIYWVTNTITFAMRIYIESFSFNSKMAKIYSVPVKAPTACMVPEHDPFSGQTRGMLEDSYHNLVSFKHVKNAGHFMTMQYPELVAKDILQLVSRLKSTSLKKLKRKAEF